MTRQPLGRKPMSPGDDPRCDAGGDQKVVLTERQVLLMPAGLIHMVETLSKPVALGVNFIHREHLLTAARVFFSSCYPDFQMLALNEFMVHLWYQRVY